MLYGKSLLNVSIMENEVKCGVDKRNTPLVSFSQVLGNALDGMELEDDAKNIPQVFSQLYLIFS